MRRNRSGRLVHLLGIWLTVAPEDATSEMTGRLPLPCSLDSIHLDSICRCGGAGASLPGGAQERDQVAAPRSLWIPMAGADPELLQMDDDDARLDNELLFLETDDNHARASTITSEAAAAVEPDSGGGGDDPSRGEMADWRTGPKGRAPKRGPLVGALGSRGSACRTTRGAEPHCGDVALTNFLG
jgi:hypothetical protein